MRNYLVCSGALHAAMILGGGLALHNGVPKTPKDVYRIDFIGGGNPAPAAPAPVEAAAPKPQPAPDPKLAEPPNPNEIERPSKGPKRPLLKPSVLSEPVAERTPEPPAAGEGEGAGPANVTADFPNFPYPWYITQVRAALAAQWARRMPRGGSLECVVRVRILRNGEATDVAIEAQSGNSLFDYAAVSSVRGAAPFPPLPEPYLDDMLNAHIQFRTLQ